MNIDIICDILINMANVTETKIKEVMERIVQEFQPEKIILFGSYAWGAPTKDSDVDLFIVKKGDKSSLEMMQEVNRIVFKRDFAMDFLVYTTQQLEKRKEMGDPFIKLIMESGKILYAK